MAREQYPTIFEKAAVYLRNIVGDQPFSDGNKPTAITVCGIFLKRNSISVTANPKDLEDFVLEVATSHREVSEIADWLQSHSK